MDARGILALVGSGLLFAGVFLPLLSAPLLGATSLIRITPVTGVLVLLSAALVGFGALSGRRRMSLAFGCVALAATLFWFVATLGELEDHRAGVGAAIQIQWGWAVLFLGALLSIGSYFMKRSSVEK